MGVPSMAEMLDITDESKQVTKRLQKHKNLCHIRHEVILNNLSDVSTSLLQSGDDELETLTTLQDNIIMYAVCIAVFILSLVGVTGYLLLNY